MDHQGPNVWGRVYQEVDSSKYPQGYAYVRFQTLQAIALFLETSIQFTSLHPVGVGTGILVGN